MLSTTYLKQNWKNEFKYLIIFHMGTGIVLENYSYVVSYTKQLIHLMDDEIMFKSLIL